MKFPVSFANRDGHCAGPEKRRRKPIIGLLAVLLLVTGLQACSVVKIAYNQAIELSFWQLDAYFDFNDTQKPRVREELAKVHQWHRQTQLPVYIEALQRWQPMLTGEVTEAQACAVFDEVRSKLQVMIDRSLPIAVSVAATLVPEQLNAMQKKFSKVNSEFRSEFIEGTPAAVLEKRFKKSVSRAEMLYGSLDEPQLAVLKSRLAQSAFDANVTLGEFQRRQRDALQSLAPLTSGPSGADQARPVVQAYLYRAMNSPNAAYRAYLERMTRDSCATFAALHNSTTPAQRAKAVETLSSYVQDFRLLTAQR